MGYETKLFIGKSSFTEDEIAKGDMVISDGEAYKPYLKNDKGEFVKTGKVRTYFMVYAMIDLCKCGDGNLLNLDWKNKDESRIWYWYDGDTERTEDCYGDNPKPVSLAAVIDALEKDNSERYRRFDWALALLKSMVDDKDEIQVLLYGH